MMSGILGKYSLIIGVLMCFGAVSCATRSTVRVPEMTVSQHTEAMTIPAPELKEISSPEEKIQTAAVTEMAVSSETPETKEIVSEAQDQTATPSNRIEAVEAPVETLAPATLPEQSFDNKTADEKGNKEQEKMDEALDLLNQSQDNWEKGELDTAMNILDKAYGMILETDGDPDIVWQRDDIRLMIAKRIVEIYAARANTAVGNGSEIPMTINDDVRKEIRIFQTVDRQFFLQSYKRSGRFQPLIVEFIREAGLPEELSWLPLVESGFKISALSKARALGLWQFIPSTGYRFGLKRDYWLDERMDVEKSTRAAIEYLKALHGIFGDWLTVLAAYNCGEGRVLRVISQKHLNYLDNFWDLYRQLPFETARYVPRFLAALEIVKNPDQYGFKGEFQRNDYIPYERVETNRCLNLAAVAEKLGCQVDLMKDLNAELRYGVTPDRSYELKIPKVAFRKGAEVIEGVATAKKPGGPVFVQYKVKSGDVLSTLARDYKTSIPAIMAANGLRDRHTIRAGQWLKIPASAEWAISKSALKDDDGSQGGRIINYNVQKGDSLWRLARRYDTKVSTIKQINNLSDGTLAVGQIIKIGGASDDPKEKNRSSKLYRVQKGDSLYSIALATGTTIERLLELNGLTVDSTIFPEQMIRVE
ncbi:MAG: LysM peptidoglycan-binding domain-containing protein [Deltaproteobacteria bacterium]|nr:LysM peptidoglycan-binding domain-containing protein [Deltaproteobacteria bacterium]